eukprot:Rmarinus@m.2941
MTFGCTTTRSRMVTLQHWQNMMSVQSALMTATRLPRVPIRRPLSHARATPTTTETVCHARRVLHTQPLRLVALRTRIARALPATSARGIRFVFRCRRWPLPVSSWPLRTL